MRVASRVPAGISNHPIIDYLAARFTYRSVAEWRLALASNEVWHNDVLASSTSCVSAGDQVACIVPDTPVEIPAYELLYEDEWLMVVDKPAGLRVHGKGEYTRANLIYHIRHVHQPATPTARLINRLDADTTGLVLIARDRQTVKLIQQQYDDGTVEKVYYALVEGIVEEDAGIIDAPLGSIRDGRQRGQYTEVDFEAGRPSLTEYTCIERLGARYSLLELKPRTGRTHQLRVHLAHIGHPIVGDERYGGSARVAPHHQLHCAITRITHPYSGDSLTFQAAYPATFTRLRHDLAQT